MDGGIMPSIITILVGTGKFVLVHTSGNVLVPDAGRDSFIWKSVMFAARLKVRRFYGVLYEK